MDNICFRITIYTFYYKEDLKAFKDKRKRGHIKKYIFIIILAIELNLIIILKIIWYIL